MRNHSLTTTCVPNQCVDVVVDALQEKASVSVLPRLFYYFIMGSLLIQSQISLDCVSV